MGSRSRVGLIVERISSGDYVSTMVGYDLPVVRAEKVAVASRMMVIW